MRKDLLLPKGKWWDLCSLLYMKIIQLLVSESFKGVIRCNCFERGWAVPFLLIRCDLSLNKVCSWSQREFWVSTKVIPHCCVLTPCWSWGMVAWSPHTWLDAKKSKYVFLMQICIIRTEWHFYFWRLFAVALLLGIFLSKQWSCCCKPSPLRCCAKRIKPSHYSSFYHSAVKY